MRLAFPLHHVTPAAVHELKRILADHPGDAPVHLCVRGPTGTTVSLLGARVGAESVASDVKGGFVAGRAAGRRDAVNDGPAPPPGRPARRRSAPRVAARAPRRWLGPPRFRTGADRNGP